MGVLALLATAAAVVGQDQAVLRRTGCGVDDEAVARLAPARRLPPDLLSTAPATRSRRRLMATASTATWWRPPSRGSTSSSGRGGRRARPRSLIPRRQLPARIRDRPVAGHGRHGRPTKATTCGARSSTSGVARERTEPVGGITPQARAARGPGRHQFGQEVRRPLVLRFDETSSIPNRRAVFSRCSRKSTPASLTNSDAASRNGSRPWCSLWTPIAARPAPPSGAAVSLTGGASAWPCWRRLRARPPGGPSRTKSYTPAWPAGQLPGLAARGAGATADRREARAGHRGRDQAAIRSGTVPHLDRIGQDWSRMSTRHARAGLRNGARSRRSVLRAPFGAGAAQPAPQSRAVAADHGGFGPTPARIGRAASAQRGVISPPSLSCSPAAARGKRVE